MLVQNRENRTKVHNVLLTYDCMNCKSWVAHRSVATSLLPFRVVELVYKKPDISISIFHLVLSRCTHIKAHFILEEKLKIKKNLRRAEQKMKVEGTGKQNLLSYGQRC